MFLNENLGFAISTGKIFLKQHVNSMYVTNDSGKTFQSSNFKYENDNVTYLDVVDLPYFENNTFVLIHQNRKNTQKTPKQEVEKAK